MKKRTVKISLTDKVKYSLISLITCAGITVGLTIPAVIFKICETRAHEDELVAITEYLRGEDRSDGVWIEYSNYIYKLYYQDKIISKKEYDEYKEYSYSDSFREYMYDNYPQYFNDEKVNELDKKTNEYKNISNAFCLATLCSASLGFGAFGVSYSLYNKEKKEIKESEHQKN